MRTKGKGSAGAAGKAVLFSKVLADQVKFEQRHQRSEKAGHKIFRGWGAIHSSQARESQITQSLEVETYLASLRDSKEASVVGAQCARGAARK